MLMVGNCKKYNGEGSPLWRVADHMEAMARMYVDCGRKGIRNFRGKAAAVYRARYKAEAAAERAAAGEGTDGGEGGAAPA